MKKQITFNTFVDFSAGFSFNLLYFTCLCSDVIPQVTFRVVRVHPKPGGIGRETKIVTIAGRETIHKY